MIRRKRKLILIIAMKAFRICALALLCFGATAYGQSAVEWVNLFICTQGDHGQLDPSASAPFGMVKLGPDTDPGNHSGYDYSAQKIIGFSHNRIGGTGCSGAGGNLRILPGIGQKQAQGGVAFSKRTEKARPGYYEVALANGIHAELTASGFTGVHRYTFPASDSAFLRVDTESSFAGTYTATSRQVGPQEFQVEVTAKNTCEVGRYRVFYHVWCSKPLNEAPDTGPTWFISFSAQAREEVLLYVTASSVSAEAARRRWESQAKGKPFDAFAAETAQRWERLLSRIEVEGGRDEKVLFYSHLYHLFLNPVQTDYQSAEVPAGGEPAFVPYGCWSMWDNFRTKFPLYPYLVPEEARDIAHSLAHLYRNGMPSWSGYNEPAPTVRTEFSLVTLLDFYRKGITDFDLETVYGAMSAEITNIAANSPDKKLELSYDYWALAQFADILGRPGDQAVFLQKANEYRKVWKEQFLPITPESDIVHAGGLYEGTFWQYRWHVQFDIPGIIELAGGPERFAEELEFFFDNDLYNHGNQPDIHAPYLFNACGKPWLTQKWVNRILTKDMTQYYGTHEKWATPYIGRIYKNAPDGYIPEMDDDEGTMSGWYVLAAMGLFPAAPGIPVFQLSAPLFQRVVLHLGNGRTLTIKTDKPGADFPYIQSAAWNGAAWNAAHIPHEVIASGGTLEFELGKRPNVRWGR